MTLAVSAAQCMGQYFPKSSLDLRGDDFKMQWYSAQLRALKEPSLLELAQNQESECYRFLWLRTFNHPVAVRVNVNRDGSAVLTTKVANGAGGYGPGVLIVNTSRKLTGEEEEKFLSRVNSVGFWSAPNPVDDQTGTDGSQWVIEGVKASKYHVVDRWMPKAGPSRELGLLLAFDLARMNIPQKEIY